MPSASPNIVLIGDFDSSTGMPCDWMSSRRWHCYRCPDLAAALDHIASLDDCVVFCEADATGSWRSTRRALEICCPRIPMIVVMRFPDERLWLEALEAGCDDVMLFPFDEGEFAHVMRTISARQSRVARQVLPAPDLLSECGGLQATLG